MAWTITKDHIAYLFEGMSAEPEKTRVGYGEGHTRISVQALLLGFESEPLPFCDNKVDFQLYDDDGELYYEGTCDDDDECENQSAALKWAEGDAGCTTIKVKRGDEWVQEIG